MESVLSCLRALTSFISGRSFRHQKSQISVASLADQNDEFDENFSYVHKLLRKLQEDAPQEDIIASLRVIGHISYLGMPDVQKACVPCVSRLAELLASTKTTEALRQQIVMTLSELCYLNLENQKALAGTLEHLASYIADCHKNASLCRWSCYAVCCITANNYETLRKAHCVLSLKKSIQMALNSSINWDGWYTNYAQLLADMLGMSN